MSFLDSLAAPIGGAVAFLMRPVTLHAPGTPTSDGQGGQIAGTPINHACAGLVTDYSDALKAISNGAIQVNDRKLTVTAASMPAGIVPQIGWGVTADGGAWAVIAVKRDPAGATYDLQVRPA